MNITEMTHEEMREAIAVALESKNDVPIELLKPFQKEVMRRGKRDPLKAAPDYKLIDRAVATL